MTKSEFRKFLEGRTVLVDGATGSNLQAKGMPPEASTEVWILEHPEIMKELQKAYIEAGSNIIYAPTFAANRIKFKEYGLQDRVEEFNTNLVALSKEVAADYEGVIVAGDMSMTGEQLEPMGDLTMDELIDAYAEQFGFLKNAGVDVVILETMMSLQEARAFAIAAKRVDPDFATMVSMTFNDKGFTLFGASAESAMIVLQSLGVDAVGLNCSAGPDMMRPIVERMKAVSKVPVIAKPNAGLPKIDASGNTVYDMNAEDFGKYMHDVIAAGANIVGGCCGTNPDYIKALKQAAEESAVAEVSSNDGIVLSNERKIWEFDSADDIEFGDGIDFCSNEDIMAEYEEDAFDEATDIAMDLMDDEVDALLLIADCDDEADLLNAAIPEITMSVQLPIIIKTGDSEALDSVLQNYAGVAGVIPSGDASENEAIKSVASFYGAVVIE